MIIHALVQYALLAAPAPAAQPVRLQALIATSGNDPAAALDGDLKNGWVPEGDASGVEDEGLTLKFDAPIDADHLQVVGCTAKIEITLFADGERSSSIFLTPDAPSHTVLLRKPSSLFFKLGKPEGGKACIAELLFTKGAVPVPVLPPKKVAGQITASSTLEPADAYHASYLVDGRQDFGWVEGAKGLGIGESVTVTLDAPLEVSALELWNGYQRSPAHFTKNARLKGFTLSVDGGAPIALEAKDAQGKQTIALPATVKGRSFKLAIASGYKGSKYEDLVISELRFVTPEGPLSVATPDAAEREKALRAAVAGKPLAGVIGRSFTTYCGPQSNEVKFRMNHTFVAWESGDASDGSTHDSVFDGAWALRGQSANGAQLDLFGRRHTISDRDGPGPYGDGPPGFHSDVTRIDGGKLVITRFADLSDAEGRALLTSWDGGEASSRLDCLKHKDSDWYGPAFAALKKANAIAVTGPALTDIMKPK